MRNQLLLLAYAAFAPAIAASQGPSREVAFPAPAVRLVLEPTPRLDLAGAGATEFHEVTAIQPRRDGSIVVANAGSKELRIFDTAGRLLKAFGRAGSGPGEYANISGISLLRDDSIAVFDRFGRRLSILAPDGRFVVSISLAPPFDGGGAPTSFVALTDGSLFIGYSVVRTMLPQRTPAYFGQELFRYGPDRRVTNMPAVRLPESEHFVQAVPPSMGGIAYWDLAFGRVLTLRALGGHFLSGDGTDWVVERRTREGIVDLIYRLTLPLARVTASDRAAFSRSAATSKNAQQRAIEERLVEEMPYPKTKPAYRRFETSPEGHIWLETYERTVEGSARWIRLDPITRTTAELVLPRHFQALAFTSLAVYGIWRDSDDVEHVRVMAYH